MILIEGYLGYLIMNSVLIRLIVVKSNKEYNVLFDSSFTLNENLKLLSSLIDENFDDSYVYDNKLNLFLNKNNSLESYNFPTSRTFYIY